MNKNKFELKEAIENIETQLIWLKQEILQTSSIEDNSTLLDYMEDVENAVNSTKNEFEKYEDEVIGVKDELKTLTERLGVLK